MATDDTPGSTLNGGEKGTTEAAQRLNELATAHENIDWEDVPSISIAEAAAWTQRLEQAREEAEADPRLVADGSGTAQGPPTGEIGTGVTESEDAGPWGEQ